MTLVALLVVGLVSVGRLPLSLMPDIDVPRITVQASVPGVSAREVDLSVVQPLRRELLQLPSLRDIRCEAKNGGATLVLTFAHGTGEIPAPTERVHMELPRARTHWTPEARPAASGDLSATGE